MRTQHTSLDVPQSLGRCSICALGFNTYDGRGVGILLHAMDLEKKRHSQPGIELLAAGRHQRSGSKLSNGFMAQHRARTAHSAHVYLHSGLNFSPYVAVVITQTSTVKLCPSLATVQRCTSNAWNCSGVTHTSAAGCCHGKGWCQLGNENTAAKAGVAPASCNVSHPAS